MKITTLSYQYIKPSRKAQLKLVAKKETKNYGERGRSNLSPVGGVDRIHSWVNIKIRINDQHYLMVHIGEEFQCLGAAFRSPLLQFFVILAWLH